MRHARRNLLGAQKIYGRYRATTSLNTTIYQSQMQDNSLFLQARELADSFAEYEGRRPRILVAKVGHRTGTTAARR